MAILVVALGAGVLLLATGGLGRVAAPAPAEDEEPAPSRGDSRVADRNSELSDGVEASSVAGCQDF